MNQDRTRNWRELCEAVATELDPAKLMDLIAELSKALDQCDQKGRNAGEGSNSEDRNQQARSWRSEPAV